MTLQKEIAAIKEYSNRIYMGMTRKPEGQSCHPYIVPGTKAYTDQLWDWDSWLTDIAVRQIMLDNNDANPKYMECERGCVLNFLEHTEADGSIPILIRPSTEDIQMWDHTKNVHKPCPASAVCGADQWQRCLLGKVLYGRFVRLC